MSEGVVAFAALVAALGGTADEADKALTSLRYQPIPSAPSEVIAQATEALAWVREMAAPEARPTIGDWRCRYCGEEIESMAGPDPEGAWFHWESGSAFCVPTRSARAKADNYDTASPSSAAEPG